MGECYKKRGEDERLQLLDLIPKGPEWKMRDSRGRLRASEEKKLELRLGPPGEEDEEEEEKERCEEKEEEEEEEDSSTLSLNLFCRSPKLSSNTTSSSGAKRMFLDTIETKTKDFQNCQERKASVAPPPAHNSSAPSGSKAVANSCSQTRTAQAPVVGWPPVRSFRKKLASNSPKPSVVPQKEVSGSRLKQECYGKGLFVKINMDGVPIGRKIDLKAYDCYEKLSPAVQELFSGLLAAQRDPNATSSQSNEEEKQAFQGLLDGTGGYTLVYEDTVGDKMLVGDVPWEIFVSTAKRLRVLKNSELSRTALGAVGRKSGF